MAAMKKTPSDFELRRRVGDCSGCTPLLSDHQLCRLVGQLGDAYDTADPLYAEALLGELLARRWLYVGESAVVRDFVRLLETPFLMPETVLRSFLDDLLPYRETPSAAIEGGLRKFTEAGNVAEAACGRIRSVLEADGLIALVTVDEECVGVPFKFDNKVTAGEICDFAGETPANWEEDARALAAAMAGDKGVRLCCKLGKFNEELHGGSFALPVLLAWKLDIGSVCNYPALKFLATGAVEANRIGSVKGMEYKLELARRMGVRFVAPMGNAGNDDAVIALTPGILLGDAVRTAGRKLEPFIADDLSAAKICRRLEGLDTEVHKGKVSHAHAKDLMERYRQLLSKKSEDDYTREGTRLLLLLDAAIANHSGNPKAAEKFIGQALDYTEDGDAKSKLLSRLIVSLTDSGQMKKAVRRAKELLSLVNSTPWRLLKLKQLNQCKMWAHGAYGGEVLLNLALQGKVSPEESRLHLEQNLTYAKACVEDARDLSEVARGHARLALWSAFFEPEEFLAVGWDETAAKMKALFPDEADSSFLYLRRTRFLAGYRLILQAKPPPTPAEFEEWELPEKPSWLKATALKYRGALYAGTGKFDKAQDDFKEALSLLETAQEPLMRFIAATVAWEAARILAPHSAVNAEKYCRQMRNLFAQTKVNGQELVTGHCAAKNWKTGKAGLGTARRFPY